MQFQAGIDEHYFALRLSSDFYKLLASWGTPSTISVRFHTKRTKNKKAMAQRRTTIVLNMALFALLSFTLYFQARGEGTMYTSIYTYYKCIYLTRQFAHYTLVAGTAAGALGPAASGQGADTAEFVLLEPIPERLLLAATAGAVNATGSGYPIDRADVLAMQLLPQEHQPTGVPHDVLLPEDLRRVRLLDSRGGLLWMQPLRPSSFSP